MLNKLGDYIYENRKMLLKYLCVALILSVLRTAVSAFLSAIGMGTQGATFVAWLLWAVAFYPLLALFVFKNKLVLYSELRRIIIYIVVCTVLWFTWQLFISVLAGLSGNSGLGLALGGAINELLCVFAMIKVFNKK